MPGRQAHGRPLLADPNKKRKGGKKGGGNGGNGGGNNARTNAPSLKRTSGGAPRTRQGGRVDVMAMAEQQIGETRAKGVRVRDMDIDRDGERDGKRGRDEDDEDEEDEDDEGGAGARPKKRRHNDDDDSSNEIHSDSSGNEWREGVGSDDDDSEIDSDEAFGDSDDDEIFDAFAFKGSSSKTNKNKKKKAPKNDDDFDGFDDPDDYDSEDVGDDGADLGDEAIDLAAALDIVSSDEEEEASSSKKDQSRKKKKQQADDSDLDMSASDASDVSGSDDEDDSASGSDELSSTESSDYDSDDEEDEDDEEAGLGKSDALQSIASAYAAGQGGDSDEDDSDVDMAESANPYQFNAQIGSKDRSLKKSIKAATGSSSDKKLDVPLLPMQQDKQLRVAAAEKAHETLDRWTETVKSNRRAEHLTFDVAGAISTSGLDTATLLPINHKSAQTDLEKTILSIMEESGLGPQAQAEERAQQKKLERQQADEAASQLSPEALKEIIGQKRRARELQSREQARAKRIKKIKSKAYRRVHRRERQRAEEMLEASDAEYDEDASDKDSEAERDAAHRRRALERMGARHRDSRWAKRAKNTNRAAWDDEFRAGLVDMARQDEELRRRVDGAGVGGGRVSKNGAEEESDSDSFDEESDEEAFKLRTREKLAALEGGADEEPKGLMGIAFMQKAEQARKKANDEAVAEIMRDLDRGDNSDEDMIDFGKNGGSDDDAADNAVGRRSYGPVAGQKPTTSTDTPNNRQARRQQAALEREAAAVAAASKKPSHAADVSSTFTARTATSAPGDAGSWTVVPKTSGKDKKSKKAGAANGDSGATPGLTADGRLVMSAVVDDVLAQNKAAETEAVAKETAASKKAAAKAAAAARAAQNGESETSSSGSDSDDDDDDYRGSTNRSKHFRFRAENEQLLRKALGEDGAAAEFAAEKVRQAAEEAAAWEEEQSKFSGKKNKNADMMPGWGSWVGEGVSKRSIKRDQRAITGGGKNGKKDSKEVAVVRRDAKMDKVIISERRVHKNEKYLASQLPHEFETRSQYERSLRLPVGPEWSTQFAFQDATKPRVMQKQGVVLPMAKPQM